MTAFSALNFRKAKHRAHRASTENHREIRPSLSVLDSPATPRDSQCPLWLFSVSSVLFRKARYENVRFLQTFRRLVVQDIEEEDFSRPANDAELCVTQDSMKLLARGRVCLIILVRLVIGPRRRCHQR